jgi:hypothetical protein
MNSLEPDVVAAKRAIGALFQEKPRPKQNEIAAVTGLTQSYVAKIAKCEFQRLNAGIRKVWEYSNLSRTERSARLVSEGELAARLSSAGARLAARDPDLGEEVVRFVERVAKARL